MSNTTINTTVYTGTFTKTDGSRRTMRFVKWKDVPGNPDLVAHGEEMGLKRTSGIDGSNAPGVETVYDVEAKGYRSFNNGTIIGSLSSVRESVTFG